MTAFLLAAAVGAVIGALRRPHGTHLRSPVVVYPAIVVIGAGLQLVIGLFDPATQGTVLGVSLAALTGFALVNRHIPGMGVLGIGLGLNMAVVLANAGMPVRPAALVDAGVATPETLADTDPGAGRSFERDDDLIPFLGDIIPVEPLGAAMSFGDLIALMGIGAVSGELVRHARSGGSVVDRLRRPRGRRLESQSDLQLGLGIEAVRVGEGGGDVEELTTLIDLVDAEDRVGDQPGGEPHGGERAGVSVPWRGPGDGADEVLAGQREQHRAVEPVE